MRNNIRQNCDTMQPCTHILPKSRRSAPSSAAFSLHCTSHNRISLPTNILLCLRPALNGRTSGHKLINMRVVNIIFFYMIMNSMPLTAHPCLFLFFLSSIFLLLSFNTIFRLCPTLRSVSFPAGVSLKTAVPILCSVPRGSVDTCL